MKTTRDAAILIIPFAILACAICLYRVHLDVLQLNDCNQVSIVGPTYFKKGCVMYAVIFMVVVVLISFGVGAFVGREAEKMKLFGPRKDEENEVY